MYVAFETKYGWFSDSELGYFLTSSSRIYNLENFLLISAGINHNTPMRIGFYDLTSQEYQPCMAERETLTSSKEFVIEGDKCIEKNN